MSTESSDETPTAIAAPEATPLSKSAFIRGLSSDLRPREVIALAKERGIIISGAYVRQVRAAARDRAMRAMHTGVRLVPAAAEGPFAALYRSLPAGVSYSEAAARAKAAGVILSERYFYALGRQRNLQTAVKSKVVNHLLVSASEGMRIATDDGRKDC